MKLSLECDVDSKTVVEAVQDIEHEGGHYIFFPNAKGFLGKIRIIKPINNPEHFYDVFEKNEKGMIVGLRGGGDAELFDWTVQEFQHLESMLGFSVEVRKVHWESPSYTLIPETDEERLRVQFENLQIKPGARRPAVATPGELRAIVKCRDTYKQLSVVQAFWREGRNDYDDQQYISAFANFYYILEDRYAPGVTSTAEVHRRFKESTELNRFVQFIVQTNTAGPPHNHSQVLQMLTTRQKDFDPHGVIYLLAQVRGEIHHFVEKSRRVYANPFRNKQYGGIALLALVISSMIISERMVEIRGSTKSSPKVQPE